MTPTLSRLGTLGLLISALQLGGCASIISSSTAQLGQELSKSLLNANDPQIVLTAIPSYLLLQEALLRQQPDNQELLLATATLYRAYSSLLEDDSIRLAALSDKALTFSRRAACLQKAVFCHLESLPYPEFEQHLQQTDANDAAVLFDLGASWALWIQAHKTDWNAIAQLAQIKAIMQHLIKQQPDYQHGAAHLYLGVLASLIPPAMGGNLTAAKQHFEQALELSEGKNLAVKVLYAKHYARMAFERPLHDKLLNEVLNANPVQEDLTLINLVMQQRAKELLKSAASYF